MAKRFRLGKPELAGALEKLSRQARLPREVERLTAVRMAMSGDFTFEQIALACGRWKRLGDIARWLRERRGVEMGLGGVGYHVRKMRRSRAGAAPDSPPKKARRERAV